MIYLASPYSDVDTNIMRQRFEQICKIAARLMAEGHVIFSPIAHTHPIVVAGALPTGFDYWRQFDEEFIAACTELWVVMIEGWNTSVGVQAELRIAERLGKPVRFIDAAV